jgi:regulator of cell morphogenesis and NO signaling
MIEKNYRSMKVGDIVAKDFRTAAIFKKAGIDFCCGGNETLEKSCSDHKINMDEIENELSHVEDTPIHPDVNFVEWKLDVLCDYIVNTHHRTAKELMPQITSYTQKIAEVHGDNHPELKEIATLFAKAASELKHHLANEEKVLFPALKEVLLNNSQDSKIITMREMAIMKTEHEYAGSVLDMIRHFTNNYTLPPDACTTYALTYKLLEQFEDDLHIHVHLENNILYPKALELSK